MKHCIKKIIMVLILSFSFFACQKQNPEELIIGKWEGQEDNTSYLFEYTNNQRIVTELPSKEDGSGWVYEFPPLNYEIEGGQFNYEDGLIEVHSFKNKDTVEVKWIRNDNEGTVVLKRVPAQIKFEPGTYTLAGGRQGVDSLEFISDKYLRINYDSFVNQPPLSAEYEIDGSNLIIKALSKVLILDIVTNNLLRGDFGGGMSYFFKE